LTRAERGEGVFGTVGVVNRAILTLHAREPLRTTAADFDRAAHCPVQPGARNMREWLVADLSRTDVHFQLWTVLTG
jgi:hypothetical protein